MAMLHHRSYCPVSLRCGSCDPAAVGGATLERAVAYPLNPLAGIAIQRGKLLHPTRITSAIIGTRSWSWCDRFSQADFSSLIRTRNVRLATVGENWFVLENATDQCLPRLCGTAATLGTLERVSSNNGSSCRRNSIRCRYHLPGYGRSRRRPDQPACS
jgi:hypothetical protein